MSVGGPNLSRRTRTLCPVVKSETTLKCNKIRELLQSGKKQFLGKQTLDEDFKSDVSMGACSMGIKFEIEN